MGLQGAVGPAGPSTYTPALSPWFGKVVGIIGDSYCYANVFQQLIAAYHGMTIGFQDCRVNRPIGSTSLTNTIFECYGGPAFGTNQKNIDTGWGICGQASPIINSGTQGNTLAQDLANVDLLYIELGTNDVWGETLGTIMDRATTNSTYGYIRAAIEGLLQIKPTMRIVWITPIQMTSTQGNRSAQMPAITQAIVSVCATYGVPVINMWANSGFAYMNSNLYLQPDGIHPNQLGFTNLYARYIELQTSIINPFD
jgi:hypothetical protein